MVHEIFDWIINNQDKSMPVIISSGIPMFVAFLGWLIIFSINVKTQKISLKNNAKMKIYEELSKLVKNYNKICIVLGVSLNKFSAPFLQMGFIDRNLDPIQRNYEGIKIWQGYTVKIGKEISDFSEAYLEVWNYLTYWDSAIPKLKNMQKELFWKQHKKLVDELWEFQRYLQGLSQREFMWEKWNRKEIDSKFDEMDEKFVKNSAYFDDFITEVHNVLVGKIFSHCKKKRENFANLPEEYEILTIKGIKKVQAKPLLNKWTIKVKSSLQKKLKQFFNAK